MSQSTQPHFCPVGDRRRPVTILFDLDGTLMDHATASRGALGELYLAHAGRIRRDEADFRAAWSQASSAHFSQYEHGKLTYAQQGRLRIRAAFGDERIDNDDADRLFADFVEAYESRWSLFPDALPCLELLRGRPLGIVTNGNPQQQRRKLRTLGLREHFKEVLISSEFGAAKPAPGIFLEASRRLWAIPGECIVVGDSWEHDVQGALRAGMQPVWLDRSGKGSRHGVPSVRSLAELRGLVDGWQVAKPEEDPALDRAA